MQTIRLDLNSLIQKEFPLVEAIASQDDCIDIYTPEELSNRSTLLDWSFYSEKGQSSSKPTEGLFMYICKTQREVIFFKIKSVETAVEDIKQILGLFRHKENIHDMLSLRFYLSTVLSEELSSTTSKRLEYNKKVSVVSLYITSDKVSYGDRFLIQLLKHLDKLDFMVQYVKMITKYQHMLYQKGEPVYALTYSFTPTINEVYLDGRHYLVVLDRFSALLKVIDIQTSTVITDRQVTELVTSKLSICGVI